jgi:hypothetical protein
MANISGTGTLWNLPGLDGVLFTPSMVNTPLLNSLSQAGEVDNWEFPMSKHYDHEAASQPAITETASQTAPAAIGYVDTQENNVIQIYQEQYAVTYAKASASGRKRLTEVGTSGYAFSLPDRGQVAEDEVMKQKRIAMEKIRRDMEYTALNGAYQLGTDAGTAFKTRGIITGSTVNTLAAGGAALDTTKFNAILKTMAENGAKFDTGRFIVFVNAFQKQKMTALYGYAPTDRSMGGLNVVEIMTDFAKLEVAYNPFVPAATLLIVDISKCAMVFLPVPGKAPAAGSQYIIDEALAKVGAAEKGQLYLQAGFDYGSAHFHGTITGLATA